MMLRTALTAAALPALMFAVAPASAAGPAGTIAGMTQAEQTAFARCQLRQPHMQTGKGLIFQPQNCRQVARTEIAALSLKQPLAAREVGFD